MSNITEQANSNEEPIAPELDNPTIEAARAFVDKVRTLPHVRKVIIEESRIPSYIWTVISAPPFEDAFRAQVYEAEMDILQQGTYPLVGFRLINMQELEQDLMNALPVSHHVLFERD